MRLEKTTPVPGLRSILEEGSVREDAPDRVREVRLRWPDRYVEMLKEIARAESMSMNALVTICVDDWLVARGHPSILELAPGFADYLKAARSTSNRACSHCGTEQAGKNGISARPDFD